MKDIHFENIDSTSAYLKREHDNLDNLTFVSADYQTNGKGREDRSWLANKGENLLFSILIKDSEFIKKYKLLSLCSAAIVFNYLKSLGINNVSIKWPNDVYVGDRKICGILLEGQFPEYLVIGIGINVNQTEFLGEYRTSPTSVSLEMHKNVDLSRFKQSLYESFIKSFALFKCGKFDVLSIINNNNYLLNKKGIIINDTKKKEAILSNINEDGSIQAIYDKEIINVCSGEITLVERGDN